MLHPSIATTRDKYFIIGSLLSGVKRGRTMLDGYIPSSMKNIRSEIHSILHSNRTLRGDRAFALIYKRGSKRAGVVILISGPDGNTGPALYAMVVAPGCRGKKYGLMIADDIYRRYMTAGHRGGCCGSTVAVRKLFALQNHDNHPVVPNATAKVESYQEAA